MPAQMAANSGTAKPRSTRSYKITNGPSFRQFVDAMLDLHCGEAPRKHRFTLETGRLLLSLPNEMWVTEITAHDCGRFKITVMLGYSIAHGLYVPSTKTGSLSFV